MVPFSFAGHQLVALPEAALFWPARRALLVADLHLEKASWFAGHGQMLPPYDSAATLAALTRVVDRLDVREIWCLGDSFHDSAGAARLDGQALAQLAALTDRTAFTWITGNHDAALAERYAARCGGRIAAEALIDGLVLRHEADPDDPRPELSGHFHPKLRVRLHGRHVARRCFVASATKLILPAFGSLTGGLDADHPEIIRAVGTGAEALVPVSGRLLRYPISARTPSAASAA